MKLRSALLGAVCTIAALLFLVPAASAQDYPPTGGTPTVTLDSTSIPEDGTLSGSVANFAPGTATASFNPTFTFTVAADGTGSFSYPLNCQTNAGDYTLTVTSGTTAGAATFTVTEACAATAPGDDLPKTGTDGALPMTQTAVAAVAAGGLMVLIANKRRKSVA